VSDDDIPEWIEPQICEAAEWLKSKNLVHRDIHTANIVIGNLPGKKTQIFINDLAFMTEKDCSGNIIPINIESEVRRIKGSDDRMNDDLQFSRIIDRLRKKSAR